MVKVPISKLIGGELSLVSGKRADPARTTYKFALLRACGRAVVREQMKNALQVFRFKECCDGGIQIDLALRQGVIRECRSVKMAEEIRTGSKRAEK
jgi:hypothetical protein